jgi:hypothetical protein
MRKPAPAAIPALPVPVQASDLIPPSYKATGRNAQAYEGEGYRQERLMFDLWHTARFGWCIPTLQIRHAGAAIRSRNAGITQDRTYAERIQQAQYCAAAEARAQHREVDRVQPESHLTPAEQAANHKAQLDRLVTPERIGAKQ